MLDKKRVGTFILGGMAGALAAVLFAPKSGKELRGSITSRAGEARERSRETYFEAQERMQEHLSKAREHSFNPREARIGDHEESTPEPTLSRLKPATPDPVLEEPPVGEASWTGPPPLRDASRPASDQDQKPPTDTEEIRRKILETRSRLRARLESSEREDASSGSHDE